MTGPCEVCGLGYWCPGGYQSTPRRVACANNVTTPTNTSSSAYACGGGAGDYSIAVINTGPPLSNAEQAAVTAAVNKWTSVIVGDTPGVPGPYTIPANSSCGNVRPITLPSGVDDMLVLINFTPLPDNDTLGYAGVCYVDADTYTAGIGFVNMNSNQVPLMIADGILEEVVLHEMGHAQGFGILWNATGLWNCGPQLPANGTLPAPDTYYSCPKALAQFNAVGGSPYSGNKVPLQNTGGDGIWNIHWRESVMGDELMTPYITSANGTVAPLSVITVGQFEDIGHVVNYAAADPYVLPGSGDAASEADWADGAGAGPTTASLANDVKPVAINVVSKGADGGAVVTRVLQPGEVFPASVLEAWGA